MLPNHENQYKDTNFKRQPNRNSEVEMYSN